MILFFIGTAAELVKLAPVIRAVKETGDAFKIVCSGQNDLRGSELWELADVAGPDVVLWQRAIPPRATGLAVFLAASGAIGRARLERVVAGTPRHSVRAVVHGDTVSTLLGASLFASMGIPVHHVEAGLRSFRLTEPFPEEICRVAVTRLASVAYCPNPWASGNLHLPHLRKVLTGGNTLYDALVLAAERRGEAPPALQEPYFVLVVHRQENLMRGSFLRAIVQKVRARRHRPRCLFVMHALTRSALVREGLMSELEKDPSFVLLPRQPYVSFVDILRRAEYLVTDGGSNQEEAYYLGQPCLLMRQVTERIEGLAENVLLAPSPIEELDAFMDHPERWRRPRVALSDSPSRIIAEDLTRGIGAKRLVDVPPTSRPDPYLNALGGRRTTPGCAS